MRKNGMAWGHFFLKALLLAAGGGQVVAAHEVSACGGVHGCNCIMPMAHGQHKPQDTRSEMQLQDQPDHGPRSRILGPASWWRLLCRQQRKTQWTSPQISHLIGWLDEERRKDHAKWLPNLAQKPGPLSRTRR